MINNIVIYGRQKNDDDDETVSELKEVTFVINGNQAIALSEFFMICAKEMSENTNWEHKHFSGSAELDVIVFNSTLNIR